MERGGTRPFKAIAVPDSGGPEVLLVVKPMAGYGDSGEAMVRECFATLWARAIEIPVPQPVAVNIPEGFEFGAIDYPELQELITQSHGFNFATIHLGKGWKTWMRTLPPKTIKHGPLENIFSHDAAVQNTDRKSHNPNMLWRGEEVVALDFDRSFSYLNTSSGEERPWTAFLPMMGLQEHCLFSYMRAVAGMYPLGFDWWGGVEDWRLQHTAREITDAIRAVFPDPTMDLPRIEQYINKLIRDPEHFLDCLTFLSQ